LHAQEWLYRSVEIVVEEEEELRIADQQEDRDDDRKLESRPIRVEAPCTPTKSRALYKIDQPVPWLIGPEQVNDEPKPSTDPSTRNRDRNLPIALTRPISKR
ncbi:hypothetical protein (Partial), partial [Seminavis robusta]